MVANYFQQASFGRLVGYLFFYFLVFVLAYLEGGFQVATLAVPFIVGLQTNLHALKSGTNAMATTSNWFARALFLIAWLASNAYVVYRLWGDLRYVVFYLLIPFFVFLAMKAVRIVYGGD